MAVSGPGIAQVGVVGAAFSLVTLLLAALTLQVRSTRRGIVAFPATRPKETP